MEEPCLKSFYIIKDHKPFCAECDDAYIGCRECEVKPNEARTDNSNRYVMADLETDEADHDYVLECVDDLDDYLQEFTGCDKLEWNL